MPRFKCFPLFIVIASVVNYDITSSVTFYSFCFYYTRAFGKKLQLRELYYYAFIRIIIIITIYVHIRGRG